MAKIFGVLFLTALIALVSSPGVAAIWEPVVIAGFTEANVDSNATDTIVYKDQLFVAVFNRDVDGNSLPAEVWKTSDGVTWTKANLGPLPKAGTIFGIHYDVLFSDSSRHDVLHVISGNDQWWTIDGDSWESFPNSYGFVELATFQGWLFGAYRYNTDTLSLGVVRSPDGDLWYLVVADGFETGCITYTATTSMVVYDDKLWLGVFSLLGFELWNTDNGLDWIQQIGAGNGNILDRGVTSLVEFGGRLYLGTFAVKSPELCRVLVLDDQSGVWVEEKEIPFEDCRLFADEETLFLVGGENPRPEYLAGHGVRVWSRGLDSDWTLMTESDGFGDDRNVLARAAVFKGLVYVATGRTERDDRPEEEMGIQIWRTASPTPIFSDGFESNNTTAWSNSAP